MLRLGLLLPLYLSQVIAVAESPSFNRDIRPIFAEKCFQCHGPDDASREADLRLDVASGDLSPFRVVEESTPITPGSLASSELWRRLTTDDPDVRMPPADADIEPLTPEQRELIGQWIVRGAEYQEFWAFVPPIAQRLPVVKGDVGWSSNRIDRFILAGLEQQGLTPRSRADRRTLIRRVTFDLTGLPPSVAELHEFVNDHSPAAYERLVDRLLTSPRFGEQMAKYWLDLARFADTNGIHHDHYREMTPYRDWVIRAFNDSLGFDQFTVYQLAGDLFDQPSLDQQIASGFNRLHLVIDKGTAIPEESFHRNVVDRVNAVGTAFMGMTVGCAVCHDHKYDPLTQKDFYQLYAFFNNIDAGPETPGRELHAPFMRLPNSKQQAELKQLERDIEFANTQIVALKAEHERAGSQHASESTERTAAQNRTRQIEDAEKDLEQLAKAKAELEGEIPTTLVMKERAEVRPTYILKRGVYDQPGEMVERGTPDFLPPLESAGEVKTRMDLARWLTSGEHPLTARVTVNRLWQQLFGTGLVKTSEDFGTQGDYPSHPELLDELSVGFVNSGWDVKALVCAMVTSQAYQQSSKATPEAFAADPENRWLARASRFRMDAEMIRDQILVVSGLLDRTMYGRSVKPPQPPDLWKAVSMVSSSTYSFTPDTGADIHRRSLYSFWKRAQPPPQMVIFDAPTRESCIARRERTNTPLQALVLMNEEQYFKAAKQLAWQLLSDHSRDDRGRLELAYETLTSQLPDQVELETMLGGLEEFREYYRGHPQLADNLSSDLTSSDEERIELAAFTLIVNSLFNMDVTKTRE